MVKKGLRWLTKVNTLDLKTIKGTYTDLHRLTRF